MTAIEQILHDHKEAQKAKAANSKRRKDWLKELLPPEYVEFTLACLDNLNDTCDQESVITGGGVWSLKPLGVDFYVELSQYVQGKVTVLPPIPGIHTEPQVVVKPVIEKVIEPAVQYQPEIVQGLEPVKMVTEIYTTKHVIPYNKGRLPLFSSL